MKTYSYSVIKFASNPITGESINIGAVVFDEQAKQSSVVGFDLARVSSAFGPKAEVAASVFLTRLKADYDDQSNVSGLSEILRCFPDQGTSTTFSNARKFQLPEFVTLEDYLRSTFVSGSSVTAIAQEEQTSETVRKKPEPATRRKPAQIRYPKLVPGT